MINTLIIDDNKIMREYFQTMIDWESKGFKLVSVANNGIAGWQEFNKYLPQLVITDVQMPGMSGLELARMIKEKSPDTTIVFISNYEDFNYVKGAMDIGAYDYILKHETRGAKFEEKLEKIRANFEKHSHNERRYLESQLILSFSSIGTSKLETILPDNYNLIIFEQASILHPFMELANTDVKEIDENLFQSYFSKFTNQLICGIRVKPKRHAVLLNAESDPESFANGLCKYIYSQTKSTCYAMIIGRNQPIYKCLSAYLSNENLINTKFFYKYDNLITINDNNSIQTALKIEDSDYLSIFDQPSIDKACELLDHYSRLIIENKNYEQLCTLTSIMLKYFSQRSNRFKENVFVLYNENDIKFWTTADEIFFWLKNKLMQIMTLIKQNPDYNYSRTVKNAISYIFDNYSNSELSIGNIANHVGLDQNKLNKIMKDETGQTTIKWLTNIRIDKAKELLKQGKRLTQIYSDVGYTNLSYFSNVFKKVCGITPLEYRRNTLEK